MPERSLGNSSTAPNGLDERLLDRVLTRPIAFHKVFADIAGSITAGLMLSQAYYWTPRTRDPDGWFYKTQREWEDETGLTRCEQETARRRLRDKGLVEERLKGIPARLYFRVNKKEIVAAIDLLESQFAESRQTSMSEPAEQERINLAAKNE
jgi:hypothetical protein